MRRTEVFVLAVAAFNLGAVDGASSGDLGRPVYAPSPPVYVSAPYVWSTCYGGLNAGGLWSLGTDSFGFTGGGQLGCNWQLWSSLVVGGEADLQYTGLNGSSDISAPSSSAHQDFRSRWLATFRGRFGWLATPNMYFYATGGFALANVNTDSSVNFNGTINNLSELNNTCRVDARCRFGMDVRTAVVGQSGISLCRSRSRQQPIADFQYRSFTHREYLPHRH